MAAAVVVVGAAVLAVAAIRGGEPSATPSASNEFRQVVNLCTRVDFSPMLEIMAARSSDLVNRGSEDVASCHIEREYAEVNAVAGLMPTPEAARKAFLDSMARTEGAPRPEDLPGHWDNGSLLVKDVDRMVVVFLVATDGVLVLNLRFVISGPGRDQEDQRAAVMEVAESIRDAVRR